MAHVSESPASIKTRRSTGSKWFRSWRSKLDSLKVFSLNAEQYRFWDLCLCLTDTDGTLPTLAVIAFRLRMSEGDARRHLVALIEMGFVDVHVSPDGSAVLHRMHDWDEWQRPSKVSDPTSGDRVRRHRARKKAKAEANTQSEDMAGEQARECPGEIDVTGETSESVSSLRVTQLREEDSLPRDGFVGTYTRDAHADVPAPTSAHERRPVPACEAVPTGNGARFPGAHRHKASGKWQAKIRIDGQQRYLGVYVTPDEAHAACVAARSPTPMAGLSGSDRGSERPRSAYQMAKDGDCGWRQ